MAEAPQMAVPVPMSRLLGGAEAHPAPDPGGDHQGGDQADGDDGDERQAEGGDRAEGDREAEQDDADAQQLLGDLAERRCPPGGAGPRCWRRRRPGRWTR